MKRCCSFLFGILLALSARADNSGEALQWLQRMAMSAQALSYSGTFVYQSGLRSETSRITHSIDGDHDIEYIEMLDGSPREVIRIGDEVRCYLPESRRVVIERRIARPRFPSLLPNGMADLADYYVIQRVAPDRIAGFDTQPVLIEPRDGLRFRRQLWIDRKSGLLLKEESYDPSGEPRESFAFTELRVGAVDRDAIKARYAHLEAGWKTQDVRVSVNQAADGQWLFHYPLAGFRRVANMTRKVNAGAPDSVQMVFSDGLAAVSLFIESISPDAPKQPAGEFSMGAVNVYKRPLGKYLLVLMGDIPAPALKKFGDGIESR